MTGNEFVPRYRFITGITNAKNAVITVSETHDFSNGEIVSFRVSPPYSMVQINNMQSRIIAHDDTHITVEIDSSTWPAFVYPAVGTVQAVAVVVPSASGIIPDQYVPTINLEDAFDNVRTS